MAGSIVVVLGLVASACGARVAPYLGAGQGVQAGAGGVGASDGSGSANGSSSALSGGSPGAAGSTPGGGSSSASGSGSGAGSASSGASSAGAAGGAGSSAAGASSSVTALTPDNFPYQPAQQAAFCQGSAGNTASAPGITPTTITMGNVSGITGVLANNFGQGPQGVQALFSAVNAAGGICGRQLKLLVEDDGQDAGKNAADIADEIPKVFAFAGSTSDADNGGVQEMVNAGTPDFGAAINPNRGVSPVYWSTNGATVYTQNGHPYLYNTLPNGLKQAGNFPSRVALLAYSVPISASAAQEFQNLFSQSGASICFTDYSISPAS
ncbi:MAG TPA: ABC transporter substrate-binding protein, partial [Acidimicrobiales bacterium]|nr:ABC transporter substrate-binding protein [Acidimicrobiales bacterium]